MVASLITYFLEGPAMSGELGGEICRATARASILPELLTLSGLGTAEGGATAMSSRS